MTKFFAQFLFSVMIGVSAAVGLNSNLRGELKQTVHDTRVLVQETAQTALETASDLFAQTDMRLDTSVGVSTEGGSDTSSSVTDAQLTGAGNLNLSVSPTLNADSSLAADSHANTDLQTEDAELSLTEELNSMLGLNFGLGN